VISKTNTCSTEKKEKALAIMLQASYQMLNQQQKNNTTLINLIREIPSP
jgi:hypothetical protein